MAQAPYYAGRYLPIGSCKRSRFTAFPRGIDAGLHRPRSLAYCRAIGCPRRPRCSRSGAPSPAPLLIATPLKDRAGCTWVSKRDEH